MAIAESFVEAAFCGELIEIIVPAEAMTAPLSREGQTTALAGIEVVIAVIKYMGECEAIGGTKVIHDSLIPFITHIFLCMAFGSGCPTPIETVVVIIGFLCAFEVEVVGAIFTGHAAPSDIPASSSLIVFRNGITIGIIVIVFIDTVENGYAQRVAIGIDPRTGVGNGVVLAIAGAAEFPVEIDFVTGATEVGIADFDDADCAVRVRVAGTDGDDTGLLFHYVDFNDYIVFILGTREELHIHIFEVAQVVESFHGTASLEFIERLALLHLQFAKNDFVLCLFVAYELDVFDNAFGNIDMKDAIRGHLYIGDRNQHVTLFQIEIFDGFQLLIHLYEVQDTVLRYLHHVAKIVRSENGISGKFHIMHYRVRHQLVRKVYAFRYFAEVWTDLGEDAGAA